MHFFVVLDETTTWNDQIQGFVESVSTLRCIFHFLSQLEPSFHPFCSRIVRPHCTSWTNWNNREVVQGTRTCTFQCKWRFRWEFLSWFLKFPSVVSIESTDCFAIYPLKLSILLTIPLWIFVKSRGDEWFSILWLTHGETIFWAWQKV